ncbi:MAG TPA: ABC transporter permease, partial [Gemmatimonadaceae bacterium]|nr:ABC transporter permease [Gemmatimonadaceae bacterium]
MRDRLHVQPGTPSPIIVRLREGLGRDIRWGTRSLGRSPGLALAVILTLALSIGAATVMFSVVNGILIDPLPFGNSDRLLWTINRGTRPYDAMAPLDLRDWGRLIPSVESVGSWTPSAATLDDGTTPVHVDIAEVTDNWFSILGVRPRLGRGFVRGEQGQQVPSVIVLGDGLWRSHFGADPRVVGRVVHVNGAPYTVVGIAPPGFDFPDHVAMWRPVALVPAIWASRGARVFRGPVALLRPGATLAAARREARVAAAQMRQQDPASETGLSFDLESLHDHLVGNTRRPLIILLAAVGVLLLIACVNVATLLVVRSSARSSEIGIRLALGASRGRIASQVLVESSLLAAAGGALGVVAAFAGVRAVVDANVGDLPLLVNVRLEPHVLAFSLAVTIVAGLAFGVGPALRSSRADAAGSLRPGTRGMSANRSSARLRESLVAAQVALGVPLLIGALLLATSFSRLVSTDPGFRADQLIHFDVTLPSCGTAWLPDPTCSRVTGSHYTRPDEIRRFTHEMLDRLRAMPGTVAASAGMGAPFTSWAKNQGALAIAGRTTQRDAREVNPVEVKYIAADYFKALGASMLRGRGFTASDYHGRDYCATTSIVSEGAVRTY